MPAASVLSDVFFYIVRTNKGLVLIDAGMDSSGADVHTGLREMNAGRWSLASFG